LKCSQANRAKASWERRRGDIKLKPKTNQFPTLGGPDVDVLNVGLVLNADTVDAGVAGETHVGTAPGAFLGFFRGVRGAASGGQAGLG